MSTVVCETQHKSLPAFTQQGHYHWPSSSSERTRRQPFLRILTTENTPSDVHTPDSMSHPAEHPVPPVSHSELADAPDVIREPSRRPHKAPSTVVAHPFPSSLSRGTSHGHTRAKSTAGHVGNAGGSLDQRASRRARAASSATISTRTRLPSMLTSLLTHDRAPVQPCTATHDPDLVGSFTPTSSPRPRLQSLLSGLGASPSDAFPSAGASSLHAPSRFATAARSLSRPRHHSESPRAPARVPEGVPASPTVPSICRTPSSYSGSDYFPLTSAPSSAGPTTPVHTAALPLPGIGRKSGDCLTLHPVLEDLERSSMFRVQTACATCGKRGSNFPTCPKCGEMWCSRPCRLQKGNGKRHICAKRC